MSSLRKIKTKVKKSPKDVRKETGFFVDKKVFDQKTTLAGLRRTVFLDRYSLKSEKGVPLEEYPEQMWARVAKGIAQFEKTEAKRLFWEKRFFEAMAGFKFVPAGRILSGAGSGYGVTFFNCYVIPSPKDSRGGIMESITQTVEIQARGGGVGLNLSSLRPRGARVKKVNGTSSGPVNWASLYSTANYDVIQQGGSRRGALMLMLHDWHPDVEEFIRVKEDLTKIRGANLSVCVSDNFMKAVKSNSDWKLVFPDIEDLDYDSQWDGDLEGWKALGKKVKVYRTVKARALWEMICEAAWRSAEPGLHFLQRSNKQGNTWYFEKLSATNPCGEQPLGEWAVCNLGAMNLAAFVDEKGKFNFDSLKENVRVAMRFLDNVVDANDYFFKKNEESQLSIRRTGLGTMGLGDALIKMRVRYGSKESLGIIEKIYKTIRDSAYETSNDLAKEKGSFPKFDKAKYLKGYFIKKLPEEIKEKIRKQGIRNAVLLTQAPTGTTSLLSGVSSGIEPNYDFEFKRTDRTGEHLVYHALFKKWRDENPDGKKPHYFVTSKDLSPEDHIKVQAKVQEFTDSSISKTVNAPEDYSVEKVKKLYSLAYNLGCKGITFFRDGSREGVLERITVEEKKNGEVDPGKVFIGDHEPLVERPLTVKGATYRLKTPVGAAFITINQDERGEPLELFVNVGKAGSDVAGMAEALGRTISTSLRFRGHLSALARAEEIARQLTGIGGRHSVGFGPSKVLSLPDAIGITLAKHFGFKINGNGVYLTKGKPLDSLALPIELQALDRDQSKEEAEPVSGLSVEAGDLCPSCGLSALIYEEGCAKCYACGHSEC